MRSGPRLAGPERFAGSELTDVRMSEKGIGSYFAWSMKVAVLRMKGFDVYTENVPNERITDRCSSGWARRDHGRAHPEALRTPSRRC